MLGLHAEQAVSHLALGAAEMLLVWIGGESLAAPFGWTHDSVLVFSKERIESAVVELVNHSAPVTVLFVAGNDLDIFIGSLGLAADALDREVLVVD